MEGEGPSAVLSWAEIEYSMTWAVTKSNLPAWLYCTHREVYQDLIGLTCETMHGQYINYANPNIHIYIYICIYTHCLTQRVPVTLMLVKSVLLLPRQTSRGRIGVQGEEPRVGQWPAGALLRFLFSLHPCVFVDESARWAKV